MSFRSRTCSILLLALAAGAMMAPSVGAQDTSLRPLADAAGFQFGAAVDPATIADDAAADLLVANVNILSTRAELTFGAVQPEAGIFDFTSADAIVDFAVANDMTVRGHDLIGSTPLPEWVRNGVWTAETLSQVLTDHITAVVTHFAQRNPGVVTQWDVVADAVLPDGTPRPTTWQQVIGDGYVQIAFDAARAADPAAKLFYDDFYDDLAVTQDAVASGVAIVAGANAERSTCELVTKCAAVRDHLAALLEAGTPIDGVGFQAHVFSPDPADFGNLTAWTAELGLRWAVTEFDVPLPVTEIANPDSLAFQASTYAAAVGACADSDLCDTFVTWGITDRLSPIDDGTGGAFTGALWVDDAGQPKPAFDAIAQVLAAHATPPPPTSEPTTTDSVPPSSAPTAVIEADSTSPDRTIAMVVVVGVAMVLVFTGAVVLARRRHR